MCKRVLVSVICFIFLGVSGAFAQFGGMKLPGGNLLSSGGSSSGLESSNKEAVTTYLASTKELTQSLEKSAEAFGVKKEVLEKLAVVESLKEGNINDASLKKAREASESAQAIIKQKMDETKAPSAESKGLMAESMVHLALGIQKEVGLIGTVRNLSSQAQSAVKSASPTDVLKIKDIASTALALGTAIPMDLKLNRDILSSYVEYAKANNITAPSNATDLLKGE